MSRFFHGTVCNRLQEVCNRLQELIPLKAGLRRSTVSKVVKSRVVKSVVAALLPVLTVLVFAATPTFAESPVPSTLYDDYVSVPMNGSVSIEVLGNDDIRNMVSFAFTSPANGSFSSFSSNAFRQTLTFHYRPNANYAGQDSFGYTITDRNGYVESASVYITVFAPHDCSTCLVRHDATPINITIGGDGNFNVHFIGDGGAATGPVLPSAQALAEKYSSEAGNIELYSGENAFSGAPVIVRYLSAEQVVHVHTYYPDRHDGSMKPYIFVVDQKNEVSHWEW